MNSCFYAAYLHWVCPAGDVDDGAVTEVAGELVCIQRGAHQHHLQVPTLQQQLTQDDQQEVRLHAALVHLQERRDSTLNVHNCINRFLQGLFLDHCVIFYFF